MEQYKFTLYVAGGAGLAARALANFDRFIRQRIPGGCELTIVDIVKEPRRAREQRIVATPMLVRESPSPVLKILGDLSEEQKVISQLGLLNLDGQADGQADGRSPIG
ncbi:circadian clock KaiB family protein [Anatilimnocola floriformis]|uniref:circadian clock KaiB family protein n=1 Tax=Anatilimnocola floriformis TaxID=2948575 RepID=UPI0020C40D8A|nr:circadian clock KaiB family protein [Anatilimnocola floriformis]